MSEIQNQRDNALAIRLVEGGTIVSLGDRTRHDWEMSGVKDLITKMLESFDSNGHITDLDLSPDKLNPELNKWEMETNFLTNFEFGDTQKLDLRIPLAMTVNKDEWRIRLDLGQVITWRSGYRQSAVVDFLDRFNRNGLNLEDKLELRETESGDSFAMITFKGEMASNPDYMREMFKDIAEAMLLLSNVPFALVVPLFMYLKELKKKSHLPDVSVDFDEKKFREWIVFDKNYAPADDLFDN